MKLTLLKKLILETENLVTRVEKLVSKSITHQIRDQFKLIAKPLVANRAGQKMRPDLRPEIVEPSFVKWVGSSRSMGEIRWV